MESFALLQDLQRLPASAESAKIDALTVAGQAQQMDRDRYSIEMALGVKAVLMGLFERFNVPDDLQQAYNLAFSASDSSLVDHFAEVSSRSEKAVTGFISCLKGKLAELRAPEKLQEFFPDHDFSLADSATQPTWDLHGVANGVDDVFVQIKTGAADRAYEVVNLMTETPDTVYATSSDIYDKILSDHPELAEKLIDLAHLNSDFTQEVADNVNLLVDNHGIDVPDSIGEVLPYIGEVVLGIRLLIDIVSVEKDFKTVSMDDRARVHAMKAISLLSRFGISTVCTMAASAAGTALLPGVGSVAGTLVGAIAAGLLNRRLKPRMLQVAMYVAGVTDDDLFYFRNKPAIDAVGQAFADRAEQTTLHFSADGFADRSLRIEQLPCRAVVSPPTALCA